MKKPDIHECPFCQSPGKVIKEKQMRPYGTSAAGNKLMEECTRFRPACSKPGCIVFTRTFGTEIEAIDAWNSRVSHRFV